MASTVRVLGAANHFVVSRRQGLSPQLRQGRLLVLALVVCTLLMTACDGGDGATIGTTSEAGMPCGEGASRVELGSPHRGGPTAVFTTRGGTLYVTARRFESGGAFDPGPGRGVTLVFVGPPTALLRSTTSAASRDSSD